MLEIINPKEPIVVCDIGASPVDPTPFIDDLINNTNSVLYGFEPNEDEFKKLTQTQRKKYFNVAVGNGKTETLNIYLFYHSFDQNYLENKHHYNDYLFFGAGEGD